MSGRNMMHNLSGRVSVITGAANGIGRELAEQCALNHGMNLVLADVEGEELAEVAAGILARSPKTAVVSVVGDASTVEGVARILQATIDKFGIAPDVALLFNNVGIQGAGIGVLDKSTLEDWDYMFSVNVMSILRSTRAFLPLLMKQTLPSHIINTASMAGLGAATDSQSYGVTKRSAVAMSEAIDTDLRRKSKLVRCSVLTPAFVHTNFHRIQRIENALRGDKARKMPPVFESNTAKMLHSPGSIPVKDCVDAVFAAVDADLFYIIPPGHEPIAKMAIPHLMNSMLKGKSPFVAGVGMGGLAGQKSKKAPSKL